MTAFQNNHSVFLPKTIQEIPLKLAILNCFVWELTGSAVPDKPRSFEIGNHSTEIRTLIILKWGS